MAGLVFRGLEKIYDGGTVALKAFDLSVEDGELLALLGPSGCGKSTLLRLVAGLERATRGTIEIGGREVGQLDPQVRNVAMVFQNYALYPHKTVRGNLEFPLRLRRESRAAIDERVRHIASLLELEQLLDKRPGALSGGQAQRVAMGRALVRDPSAFLLDEPLSNLDAALRVQIRAEIAALQRRLGTTTLFVTHDQVEAMTLGHRVAVVNAGELQQVAPPGELYERPANLFVARFVGSPPMNLFEPELCEQGGRTCLVLGSAVLTLEPGRNAPPRGPRPAWAGLRPEAFCWPEQEPELPAIRGQVVSVENLGHERVVQLELGAGEPGRAVCGLAARISARRSAEVGEELELAIDASVIHWFDADGRRMASDRE